jgi:hypothetical protein
MSTAKLKELALNLKIGIKSHKKENSKTKKES